MKTIGRAIFFVAILGLAACNPQTTPRLTGDDLPEAPETVLAPPDGNAVLSLLPSPNDPDTRPQDYCRIEGSPRQLVVVVENSGQIPYVSKNQSTVAVTWHSPSQDEKILPIESIGAEGDTASHLFDVPEACFEAEQTCRFTIQLTNRRPVEGTCIVIL